MADIARSFADAVALHQAGAYPAAEAAYRAILQTNPNHPPALCNLGAVLSKQDKHDDAARCYALCLAAAPGYPDALYNLANLLRRAGKFHEAATYYQACLSANPRHASALFNLGLAANSLGDLATAIDCFQRTLALEPENADAFHRLGDALLRSGNAADGAEMFRRAVALKPDDPRGRNNLALALTNAGRPADAVEQAEAALRIKADYPDAHNTLALALEALGKKDGAETHYREAVRLNPAFADAWSNLGTNLTEQGKIDDAVDALRRSLRVRPAAPSIHSNLLLTLNYSSHVTPGQVLAEHRAWAKAFAPPAPPAPAPHAPAADRVLRIGYVSADFRAHTVAGFIETVLRYHDRRRVHITAYANVVRPDAVTASLQKLADEFRPIYGLGDDAVAEMVRTDRIDILIDLSGHTAGNRLGVFARRPAPVQATLFGYPNTTGLDAVDYRITDDISDPPGMTENFSVEQPLRLDGPPWVYAPPTEAPPVGPLPAAANGFVTFGCLNNPAKFSAACLETWAKLLTEIPDARLILLGGQAESAGTRLLEYFAAARVAGRVEILPRVAKPQYFAAYNRCDLALDPFPYNGGVTTADALFMGVPVLTPAGDSYVSRQGAMIMANAGLGEFVAETPASMVELAKMWASNGEWLAEIRAGLRPQLLKSPLTDGPGYVRRLEAGLRSAWQKVIS